MNLIPKVLMRRRFADLIYDHMAKNDLIWVLTGDLGYKMWDAIRDTYPKRFINTGSAEQALMGIGVGLASEGQIPLVYSITSFLLYRPFETIRNYIHAEKIPVKLIGSGRDKDYGSCGKSHWATEDKEVMKIFSNIEAHWPESNEDLPALVNKMINDSKPYYVNLRK